MYEPVSLFVCVCYRPQDTIKCVQLEEKLNTLKLCLVCITLWYNLKHYLALFGSYIFYPSLSSVLKEIRTKAHIAVYRVEINKLVNNALFIKLSRMPFDMQISPCKLQVNLFSAK